MHEDATILLKGLDSITFWLRPEAAPSRSEADILPDPDKGIFNVVIHAMATPRSNRAIEHLLENLNDAQFNYPGTNLRLVYTLAAHVDPKSETGVT